MFAPSAIVGDSFRADKPQIWSPTSNFFDYVRKIAPSRK
jgi:hypothetical protein